MKRILLLLILTTVIFSGCKSQPPYELMPQNNQTLLLMMEAGIYFAALKDVGVLPEIGKDDHGKLETMPVIDPSRTAFFPFLARLGVAMDQKDVIYWYVMQKENESSDWNVVKIWKTNKKNKVLTDKFPLPDTASQAKANVELKRMMREYLKQGSPGNITTEQEKKE